MKLPRRMCHSISSPPVAGTPPEPGRRHISVVHPSSFSSCLNFPLPLLSSSLVDASRPLRLDSRMEEGPRSAPELKLCERGCERLAAYCSRRCCTHCPLAHTRNCQAREQSRQPQPLAGQPQPLAGPCDRPECRATSRYLAVLRRELESCRADLAAALERERRADQSRSPRRS